MADFKIDWIDREREPQNPADPRYPNRIGNATLGPLTFILEPARDIAPWFDILLPLQVLFQTRAHQRKFRPVFA
jgi:hypothetical protein